MQVRQHCSLHFPPQSHVLRAAHAFLGGSMSRAQQQVCLATHALLRLMERTCGAIASRQPVAKGHGAARASHQAQQCMLRRAQLPLARAWAAGWCATLEQCMCRAWHACTCSLSAAAAQGVGAGCTAGFTRCSGGSSLSRKLKVPPCLCLCLPPGICRHYRPEGDLGTTPAAGSKC